MRGSRTARQVYAIGDDVHVQRRPSVRDVPEDTPCLPFHSHAMAAVPAAAGGGGDDDEAAVEGDDGGGGCLRPAEETVRGLCRAVGAVLGLSLFGLDLVVRSGAGPARFHCTAGLALPLLSPCPPSPLSFSRAFSPALSLARSAPSFACASPAFSFARSLSSTPLFCITLIQ